MRYVSDDGKYFDTIEECEKYEKKMLAKDEIKNQKIADIKAAKENYNKLYGDFVKEYHCFPDINGDMDVDIANDIVLFKKILGIC